MWQYNSTEELYHWGVKGMKWDNKKVKKESKYDPSDPENLKKAAIKGDISAEVDAMWEDGPVGYADKLKLAVGVPGQIGRGYIDDKGNYFKGNLTQATKKKWQHDKLVAQKSAEKAMDYYNKKHPVEAAVSKGKTVIDNLFKKLFK